MSQDPAAPRSVVLRGGTVVTMNDAHEVLENADVLVVDRIAAVGPHLEVPEGTEEIDASDGIVMPGMIDTHRHMWQTATRGYGADWTLTQYFVWYYLEHGKTFRPEDVYAVAAVRATVDATVDHLRGSLGEEVWRQGMRPRMPEDQEVLDNPYQYTTYKSDTTHEARGTVFGEPGSGR